MSARDKLYAYAGTPSVLPESMLDATLDAYRDEVLAEARTTWPSAAELQQAAATKRASGNPEDIAVANLLNAIANALAWLAPYRTNEGGYEMWGAATTLAQLINGATEGGAQ